MDPQLSILIPSIPSRWNLSTALYGNLLTMAEGKEIEIIMLTDNKKMTIGEKQNHLKNMCSGKYFCFLHDDDSLVSLDDIYQASLFDVDVISFKAKCRNSDGSSYIVTQQLGNPVEHNSKDGRYLDMKRPPWTNCFWHSKFKEFSFPSISYSEDWEWVKQCLAVAKNSIHIDKTLFEYRFDENVTEASTESNPYWTNPNNR